MYSNNLIRLTAALCLLSAPCLQAQQSTTVAHQHATLSALDSTEMAVIQADGLRAIGGAAPLRASSLEPTACTAGIDGTRFCTGQPQSTRPKAADGHDHIFYIVDWYGRYWQ